MNDAQPPLPPPSVLPGPNLSATPPARLQDIDTGLIIRDTLRANGELVQGLLRTISPTLDAPVDVGQVVGTYSTPSESGERTKRFRFSIAAIVAICATIAAGVVLLAYNAGAVDSVAGVAGWLTLTGVMSAGFVYRLQGQDFKHSAEGIAHAREGYQAIVDQTDADSRAELAKAYAYAIRRHADAQATTVEAQAAALDAEVQRLMLAAPSPQPRRLAAAPATELAVQEWHLDANGNPQPGVPPVIDPVSTPASPPAYTPASLPAVPGVDPVLATMLTWVASLYAIDPATGQYVNIEEGTRVILAQAPWAYRAQALKPAEKTRVWAAIQQLQPPLIEQGTGKRYVLGPYPKQAALAAVRGVLG